MFNINFCWWLVSNRGTLDLEATALPTEPQPLPLGILFGWVFWRPGRVSKCFGPYHIFARLLFHFLPKNVCCAWDWSCRLATMKRRQQGNVREMVVTKLTEAMASVTRKKLPNVYKSCPKMISLEKWYILTPLHKLPKNVGDWDKLIVAKGFKKLPKVL